MSHLCDVHRLKPISQWRCVPDGWHCKAGIFCRFPEVCGCGQLIATNSGHCCEMVRASLVLGVGPRAAQLESHSLPALGHPAKGLKDCLPRPTRPLSIPGCWDATWSAHCSSQSCRTWEEITSAGLAKAGENSPSKQLDLWMEQLPNGSIIPLEHLESQHLPSGLIARSASAANSPNDSEGTLLKNKASSKEVRKTSKGHCSISLYFVCV